MKLFILLLMLPNLLFAMPSKMDLASERFKALDASYKAVESFCESLSMHPEIESKCKFETKAKLLSLVSQAAQDIANFVIEKSDKKIRGDKLEFRCAKEMFDRLDRLADKYPAGGITYSGNETCKQLKVSYKNYLKKIK